MVYIKHNLSETKFWTVWKNMRRRCNNPNKPEYKNYGGRGIKVCERWQKFENFRDDMYISYLGHKKNNSYTSLDRINNNRGYSKENCRWATKSEQNRNTRNNHFITYNRETLSLRDWADKLKIKYRTLSARLFELNWSIKKTFETPYNKLK